MGYRTSLDYEILAENYLQSERPETRRLASALLELNDKYKHLLQHRMMELKTVDDWEGKRNG